MVAYEDLVVALTNWRINQGLPTGADAFEAFETGSVDLALPVADPVELSTSEVEALDADGDMLVAESDDLNEYSGDETVLAEGSDASLAEMETSDDVSLDAGAEQDLDFADDETAYGDMPSMDGMDASPAADGVADPQTEEVQALAIEEEIEQSDEVDAEDMAVEEASAGEVDAEEVSADGMDVEEVSADGMDVEEVSADGMDVEEVSADGMDVEEVSADAAAGESEPSSDDSLAVEEVNADEFEDMAVEEDVLDDFGGEDMPTKFSDDDDDESTVIGMGVDKLVPPDES